jgi:hypothetical protein
MALKNRLKAPRTLVRGGLNDLNQGAGEAITLLILAILFTLLNKI